METNEKCEGSGTWTPAHPYQLVTCPVCGQAIEADLYGRLKVHQSRADEAPETGTHSEGECQR